MVCMLYFPSLSQEHTLHLYYDMCSVFPTRRMENKPCKAFKACKACMIAFSMRFARFSMRLYQCDSVLIVCRDFQHYGLPWLAGACRSILPMAIGRSCRSFRARLIGAYRTRGRFASDSGSPVP